MIRIQPIPRDKRGNEDVRCLRHSLSRIMLRTVARYRLIEAGDRI